MPECLRLELNVLLLSRKVFFLISFVNSSQPVTEVILPTQNEDLKGVAVAVM